MDMTQLMDVPETADLILKSFHVHKADVDEMCLEEILYYFYTGKLPGQEFDVVSLCYATDKFQLDLICEKLRNAKLGPAKVAEVFISAERFGKVKLYDIAMEKFKKNKEMLKDRKFEEKVKKYPELLYRMFVSHHKVVFESL